VPELPEVETVVRNLRSRIVGRRILGVHAGPKRLRREWRDEWGDMVTGATVSEVRRRGKWILVLLGEKVEVLVLHLGMSGRILVQARSAAETSHTHVVFVLDRNEEMRFHDPRRFGSVTLLPDGLAGFEQETGLGPEPFDVGPRAFHEAVHMSRRALKAILLDQGVVAGLGNIYADEALFEAKLDPRRLGTSITKMESERLRKAAVKVLQRAITANGSTISSFYFGEGEQGGYQNEFLVYGRTGELCRRCATPIRRIRLAGRSTHFCPKCQSGRGKASRLVQPGGIVLS